MGKNIGKNTSKSLKYSQKLLDHAKQVQNYFEKSS